MKINFRILGKAIWEVLNFPLIVIGITVGMFVLFSMMIKLLGVFGIPLLLVLIVLSVVSILVYYKYKDLIEVHRKEQQHIVDTLRR